MTVAAEFICQAAGRLATARARIAAWSGGVVAVLKDLAPYAAVELVLPGGSILALLLWLYRRQQKSGLATGPSHADIEAASSAGARP